MKASPNRPSVKARIRVAVLCSLASNLMMLHSLYGLWPGFDYSTFALLYALIPVLGNAAMNLGWGSEDFRARDFSSSMVGMLCGVAPLGCTIFFFIVMRHHLGFE